MFVTSCVAQTGSYSYPISPTTTAKNNKQNCLDRVFYVTDILIILAHSMDIL